MHQRKLVAFMNSYTHGISGGDVCFFELAKRIDKFRRIVVTSRLGMNTCLEHGLNADFLLTTREIFFKGIIFTYLRRIINSFFLKIRLHEGDVLYASSDFLPDVIPAFFRKLCQRKAKWVQKIYHIIPAQRFIPSTAQKLSFILIKALADLVITDSLLLKNELIKRGFNADKVKVNYPGIDASFYKQIKSPAKAYQAAFLGRFHYSKGIFDLIEIWRLVCQSLPASKLIIVGGGNQKIKKELIGKILGANLQDNIILAGYLEKQASIEAIKGARMFIFPSHEEGFGIAVLEALCCGLPVIAWDLPIFDEIFQDTIIKIKENDIRLFSEEILSLVEDNKKQQDMLSKAEGFIMRYSWDNTANSELALIG